MNLNSKIKVFLMLALSMIGAKSFGVTNVSCHLEKEEYTSSNRIDYVLISTKTISFKSISVVDTKNVRLSDNQYPISFVVDFNLDANSISGNLLYNDGLPAPQGYGAIELVHGSLDAVATTSVSVFSKFDQSGAEKTDYKLTCLAVE